MRTISTFTLVLILLATVTASAQDSAKSATPKTANSSSPAIQGPARPNQEWTLVAYYDADVEVTGSEQAKLVQKRLLRWAELKAEGVLFLEKLNIRDDNKGDHLLSSKEAFEKIPGAALWRERLSKNGDVVVRRLKFQNGKYVSESFPILLGGPLEASVVLDELLKPIKAPQLLTHPGDVLVLWHTGGNKQAALDSEAVAKLAQLKFEEYDITTPDGKAKFERRMAKYSPATRLKLMQEVKTAYLQRGWAMDNDTIQFGEPQELSTLVPVTDTATLFVSKTTDPAGGRKAPAQ
jgi:hypothetical protein